MKRMDIKRLFQRDRKTNLPVGLAEGIPVSALVGSAVGAAIMYIHYIP